MTPNSALMPDAFSLLRCAYSAAKRTLGDKMGAGRRMLPYERT
jgi:hypothetical protein